MTQTLSCQLGTRGEVAGGFKKKAREGVWDISANAFGGWFPKRASLTEDKASEGCWFFCFFVFLFVWLVGWFSSFFSRHGFSE